MVANSKRDGSTRDPREDEKLVRLFVICPKTYTEKDLREEFEVRDCIRINEALNAREKTRTFTYWPRHFPRNFACGRCAVPCFCVVCAWTVDAFCALLVQLLQEGRSVLTISIVCVVLDVFFFDCSLQKWGDLDHVTVIRDRSTGESKGFGYVKYHRPYHAALAFENCNQSKHHGLVTTCLFML